MNRILYTVISLCVFSFAGMAQTTEEMTAMKEAKAAELNTLEGQLKELTGRVDALKTEVADLTDKITPYPRWDIGALGNLGFNFSSFSDWFSKAQPNTTAFNIGFSGNGFANLQQ